MQASNVSASTLREAAEAVGVSVDIHTLNAKGTRHRVKVNPGAKEPILGPRGGKIGTTHKYQATSRSVFRQGRRVHAVCWHGFRDYFRAVYAIEPDAVFRTALDTWRGSRDFEARFADSGHRNVGAPIMPISACEACECPDSGYAG